MSRIKAEEPIEDGFTNSFWNLLVPYTAGGKAVMGAATYIAIETIVGQVVRRIMKAPMNVRDSIEIHAYTVPFLGQMNFGEPYPEFSLDKSEPVDVMDQATEGAKQIPAATIGYIAQKIRQSGFKVPSFAGNDFLYLCVGKIVSRILTAYIHTSLPEDVQAGLAVLNAIASKQKEIADAK